MQCLGPFTFFDVRGQETVPEGSSSLVNQTECEMVVNLYITLMQNYPDLRSTASSIAIISPYKAQVPSPEVLSMIPQHAILTGREGVEHTTTCKTGSTLRHG